MPEYSIQILPPHHASVKAIKGLAMQLAPLSWVTLLEGDRWCYVEYCAVAFSKSSGEPIGIATLAPCDEERKGRPHIIGLWVHPDHRGHGVGMQLVEALASYSQQVYGAAPTMVCVSTQSHALASRLQSSNNPMVVIRLVPFTEHNVLP